LKDDGAMYSKGRPTICDAVERLIRYNFL
jgi:hypothetical protein